MNYMEHFKGKHFGKTFQKVIKLIEEEGALTFLVVDPPNQSPETAGKLVRKAEENNVNAVTVGGSVGAQGKLLDDTITQIKENCSLPVILFPGNIASVSPLADATYFMSLLNSLDPYYISGAQTAVSYPIKKMGLEAIPTSYIVVEPGRAVGWVGRAKLIPRNLPYLASITALAGQYMGSHLVILESGGGAESPAPKEMVAHVRKTIDIPLIVAGGVRNPDYAFDTIKAGADIIHVGTALEKTQGDLNKAADVFQGITSAVKKGFKARKV
ncbi:MAG: geranylgeranylglyceryl/heptaprenylglyceryl phosphate synthase [archaeon]